MTKKVLLVIALMLALTFVLAACGDGDKNGAEHTHSFGEWKVTKEATATETGTETRSCSCGKTQTQDIPKKQQETKQLSMLEFCSEIEAYCEATKNQPSFSFVISDTYGGDPKTYCTIYFNGEQTLLQYSPGSSTSLYGKVGTEYVKINVEKKTYTAMDEQDEESFQEYVAGFRRNMISEVEYFPDEVKKGTNFECEKLTSGNKITYFVKCSVEYGGVFGTVDYRTTIEVVDGVIVKYEDPVMQESIYTFPQDIVVELPDLSDYVRE